MMIMIIMRQAGSTEEGTQQAANCYAERNVEKRQGLCHRPLTQASALLLLLFQELAEHLPVVKVTALLITHTSV